MDEITSIIDAIQTVGFVGLLIILAVPKLRKLLGFGGNGNGHKELEEFMLKLETNHLHNIAKQSTVGEMNGKLDVLTEIARDTKDELKEIKSLLQSIKDKPC